MSDPLAHILGFYFADVLKESGKDFPDGMVSYQTTNKNSINMNNSATSWLQVGGGDGGYDMVDGDNNVEESHDDAMTNFEDIAKMLAKIGDNVNEKYKLPKFNPKTSFDSQVVSLLAERVGDSEVQQVALVLRFTKDVLKTAANPENILSKTRSFIAGHFAGWVRQYET
ncbi:uncharacterized protein [Antedon mediterranea]|uniref:uncharacterized protein n=1 Tax=Antedon mediterranea TaxID=105859 RepID=UPI003AF6FB1E